MILRENVPLASFTTLRTGGAARFVADCASEGELEAAFALARERGLPSYVLGDGSNVLAADEGFMGVIIRPRIEGMMFEAHGNKTEITAGAGVPWDSLVEAAALRGLWGLENLAGIPGTVGAAPVQNIGAYGVEVASAISFVEVFDQETRETKRLAREACAFGYRDSRFKRTQDLVIIRVGFLVTAEGAANLSYGDLARASEEGIDLSTPGLVGAAVRAIRSRKFPDLRVCGTAGSFFKNPVMSEEAYTALKARYPELPGFPSAHGVKIPLAYILDRVLALRGYRIGSARLFEAQPLVLVLDAGGTAKDVETLASSVVSRVLDATGIAIEREVRVLGEK